MSGAENALAYVYTARNHPAFAVDPPSCMIRNGIAGSSWNAEKNVTNAKTHNPANCGVNRGSREVAGVVMRDAHCNFAIRDPLFAIRDRRRAGRIANSA